MHNKILSLSLSLSLSSLALCRPKVARLSAREEESEARRRRIPGGRCATTTISERDPRKNSGGYDYVSSAETDRAECL